MGVAKDNYPRDGDTYSFVIGFAEVEVDIDTGQSQRSSTFSASATSAPSSTRAACTDRLTAGVCLGIGARAAARNCVYDPQYGVVAGASASTTTSR